MGEAEIRKLCLAINKQPDKIYLEHFKSKSHKLRTELSSEYFILFSFIILVKQVFTYK